MTEVEQTLWLDIVRAQVMQGGCVAEATYSANKAVAALRDANRVCTCK